MKVLQLAKVTVSGDTARSRLYEWLSKKWVFIWSQQRFLLRNSALHESAIMNAFSAGRGLNNEIVTILEAILPTLGISNEQEMRGHLAELRDSGQLRIS